MEEWKKLIDTLNNVSKKKNITHQEIADILDKHRSHISRFFSKKHQPTLQDFIEISKAIKTTIAIEDIEYKITLQ